MRTGPTVALAVVIVLAGCSAAGGERRSTGTLSPVSVPAEQTEAVNLPPGVTETGVADPAALANAHARLLATRSNRFRSVWTARYPNGTLYGRIDQTVRVAPGRERFLATFDVEGPRASVLGLGNARVELYGAGGQLHQRVTRNGTSSYSVGNLHLGESFHVSVSRPNPRWQLSGLFGSLAVRPVEVTRNGSAHRLVARSVSRPRELALAVGGSSPHDVSFEAIVTGRGRVIEYRLAYTASFAGREIRVVRTVDYAGVGNTSVEQPPWVARS